MRKHLAIVLFSFALAAFAQPTHVIVDQTPGKDFYDKAPVWINLVLAIVGVIGIGTAVGTLYYVGQQVKEAKEQRLLSEMTAKRQLRAYLCVDEACLKMWVEVKGVTKLQGQLFVKNVGQTPAYNVRSWTHGSIRTYPEEKPVPPPPEGMPRSTEIIPAQGKRIFIAKEIEVSAQTMQSIETPSAAYYVQGEVRYQDIFKDWHRLKVRYFFGGPAGTKKTQDSNGWTLGYLIPDSWGNTDEDE